MMLRRCPRCGQTIPSWQPVHLTCLAYRLRGLLVVAALFLIGGSALVLVRVIDARGIVGSPTAIAPTESPGMTSIGDTGGNGGEAGGGSGEPGPTIASTDEVSTAAPTFKTPTPVTIQPTASPTNLPPTNVPSPRPTPRPTPTLRPTRTPIPPSLIVRLELVNARSDFAVQTLEDGDTISLTRVGRYLNIQAVAESGIESVLFFLDGQAFCLNDRCLENGAPYAMAGDINGDYQENWDWQGMLGKHTITAVACTQDGGRGVCGAPMVVTITVTN